MPPDLALLSTFIGSNYPCLELIFMVPKVFEPLKFDYIWHCMFYVKVLMMMNYLQADKEKRESKTKYYNTFLTNGDKMH